MHVPGSSKALSAFVSYCGLLVKSGRQKEKGVMC
jgi:hypothetical protein